MFSLVYSWLVTSTPGCRWSVGDDVEVVVVVAELAGLRLGGLVGRSRRPGVVEKMGSPQRMIGPPAVAGRHGELVDESTHGSDRVEREAARCARLARGHAGADTAPRGAADHEAIAPATPSPRMRAAREGREAMSRKCALSEVLHSGPRQAFGALQVAGHGGALAARVVGHRKLSGVRSEIVMAAGPRSVRVVRASSGGRAELTASVTRRQQDEAWAEVTAGRRSANRPWRHPLDRVLRGAAAAAVPPAARGYAVADDHGYPQGRRQRGADSPILRTLARIGYVVLGIVHIVIGAIAISVAIGRRRRGRPGRRHAAGPPVPVRRRAALGHRDRPVRTRRVADRRGVPRAGPRRQEEVGLPRQVHRHRHRVHRHRDHGARLRARRHRTRSQSTRPSGRSCSPPRAAWSCSILSGSSSSASASRSYRGHPRRLREALDLPGGIARRHRDVRRGRLHREGIAVAVVGVLFVVAAVTHDPEKAGGLDSALKALAGCRSAR